MESTNADRILSNRVRGEGAHKQRNQSSLWEDDDGMKGAERLRRRLVNW